MLTPHIVTGDMLFTGDEREIEHQPGKDYVDYSGFTSDTDLKPLDTPVEANIKPYRDYSDIKDKNEIRSIIKGEDGYE